MLSVILSLLLCVLFGLYALTFCRAARAEQRYPPAGSFVTVNGLRLHYVRRGSGPTVVLLHGSEGFWQDFQAVMERLSLQYDVIAFDRPGHGYSDSPPVADCAPDAQARIIHDALQRLGVTRPLLVGHSWSGSLLLAYALAYPQEVAGLTLLGGWVHAPDARPLWLLRLPSVPLLGPLVVATLLILVRGHYLRKSLREAFAPDPVPADYARLASALWQRRTSQALTFARENTRDRAVMRALRPCYGQIQVPIVIVTGDCDQVVPPAEHAYPLHEALPHSTLTVLPDTGHELPQTRPAAVVEAITTCANATSPPLNIAPCNPQTRARELVMRYGWNAMSYQILTPHMDYWFAPDGEAVIGYARRSRVRVVAGAPVCAREQLETVIAEFEREAALRGEGVCYFGASERLQTVLRNSPHPHASIAIGAQPVWNPAHWPAIVKKHSSLRAQFSRARNKGVVAEEWPIERAHNHPDLQACLEEWTASRLLPPLHFLTESVTLDRLADRRVWVATLNAKAIGFLIASPVPHRKGWLVEQIVRGNDAPNGTAELLIDALMRGLEADGFMYVTLGLAPLSRRGDTPADGEPAWLRWMLTWARAHGTRFYNFEGLDAFKAKFKPDGWEPLYAISNDSRFSPRALYAIAAAFSDGPPALALARALFAALKQECVWWRERRRDKNAPAEKNL